MLTSPKTFLNDHVYIKVPKVLKKKRANANEETPFFNDYNKFLNTNYNVNQLKTFCSHYKLKKKW